MWAYHTSMYPAMSNSDSQNQTESIQKHNFQLSFLLLSWEDLCCQILVLSHTTTFLQKIKDINNGNKSLAWNNMKLNSEFKWKLLDHFATQVCITTLLPLTHTHWRLKKRSTECTLTNTGGMGLLNCLAAASHILIYRNSENVQVNKRPCCPLPGAMLPLLGTNLPTTYYLCTVVLQ